MQLRSGKITDFVSTEDELFIKEFANQCEIWVNGLKMYQKHEHIDDAELLNSLYIIRSFVKFVENNLETIMHVNNLYWDENNTRDGLFGVLRNQKDYITADIFEFPKNEIKNLTNITKLSIILAMDTINTTEKILRKI